MASVIVVPDALRVELTKHGQSAFKTSGGTLKVGNVIFDFPKEMTVSVRDNVILMQFSGKENKEDPSGAYARTMLAVIGRHNRAERLEV